MNRQPCELVEQRIVELCALVGLLAYLSPEHAHIAREHAENTVGLAERLVSEALQALNEVAHGPQA